MRKPTAQPSRAQWRKAYRSYLDGEPAELQGLLGRKRLARAVQVVGQVERSDPLLAELAGRLVQSRDWGILRGLLDPVEIVPARFPLAAAIAGGESDLMVEILKILPERYRGDALICAAGAGSENCVRLLLSANVDPDSVTLERFGVLRGSQRTVSALEQAVLTGSIRCARLLMSRGAARCSDHVLRQARRRGHLSSVNLVGDVLGPRRVR